MAKKGINLEFEELIKRKFEYYCKRQEMIPTTSGLIHYLIVHHVIPQKVINRYMVTEQYPKALYTQPSKRQAVLYLEAETGVCERSIWSYLNNQRHFQPSAI